MGGAPERCIDVYEKMVNMFDSVNSGDGDAGLEDPVTCVYKDFTPTVAVAMTTLKLIQNKNLYVAARNRVRTLELELRFLRTAFRCMVKWCIQDGIGRRFVDILARIQRQFVCTNQLLDPYVQKKNLDQVEAADFDEAVCNVLENIKIMKPEVVEAYDSLSSWPSPSKHPMSAELVVEFIYLVIDTIGVVSISSCAQRRQVLDLEEKLSFLGKLIWLAIDQGVGGEKLKEILIDAEASAEKAAGLIYFLWIDSEVEEKTEVKLMHPNTRQIYAGILRTLLHFEDQLPGELQVGYFEFLQDNTVDLRKDEALMKSPLKNQVETLYEELKFMKDLFINMPILCAEQKEIFDVGIHIKDMARKIASIVCLCFNSDNTATEISPGLSDILENIKLLRTEGGAIFSKVIAGQKSKFPKVLPVGFLDFLLEDLKELTSTKCDMIIDLKDQILGIHRELEFFKSFLQDIRSRPATDGRLNDVVSRIAVAAYEAEHLINILVIRACPAWYQSLWLSDFTEELRLTKIAIGEIIEKTSNATRISNIEGQGPSHAPSQAFAPNDVVIGVQDQMKLVKERLAGGVKKLDIVSVVGMPGLGKTTLAKRIYEDPWAVDYFDVRGWCYVSPYYEKKEMLLSILSSVIELGDQTRKTEDEELSEMLYKQLKGRRYLIVMDDVWGVDVLKAVVRFFPDDELGSRIMLTSRIKLIGSEAKLHSDPIELRLLTDGESWDLLQAKVFRQETCPRELQLVGREIAQKCSGLPLAVVVIAGLLARSGNEKGFWEQVSGNLSSHILDDAEGQGMEVLELSYKLLPEHLKPLFLYLGAFSVDKVIPVRKLTWQWIAEGFVQKTQLKSLEDEAEKHLMDLIDRSLVIVAERRSNGRVKMCRVHDLLRDLCLMKANEENFLQRVNVNRSLPDPLIYEHGRLSRQAKQHNSFMPCNPTMHSLLFSSDGSQSSYERLRRLYRLRWRRVLDSESRAMDEYLFPVLEKLVYLRYLSIESYCNSVLPPLANLWNLETLIVKGLAGEILVPDEIWRMAKLRHLHIKNGAKFNLDDNASENSSRLLNLETFSTPLISSGLEKKLMERVPNVRKLRCIFLGSWDFTLNRNVLPQWVLPDQIESLNVRCHGSLKYPCGFDLPLSLKKLTLSEFHLQWNAVSSFQKLLNLEVLKLVDAAAEGELWDVGEGEFPRLKFLKLERLDIKQWNASSDNFPCLERLVIQRCEQLVEIPSSLGDIYSLCSIVVRWCNRDAAMSAKQIQREQMDYGNELLKVHTYHR